MLDACLGKNARTSISQIAWRVVPSNMGGGKGGKASTNVEGVEGGNVVWDGLGGGAVSSSWDGTLDEPNPQERSMGDVMKGGTTGNDMKESMDTTSSTAAAAAASVDASAGGGGGGGGVVVGAVKEDMKESMDSTPTAAVAVRYPRQHPSNAVLDVMEGGATA